MGLSRAAEMAFTGEPIDAATALDWGLVSKVTTPDDLPPEARALASRIAANPPRQLRLTKKLMRESQHTRLAPLLELSATYQGVCNQTDDHREAVNALLGKQSPQFTGA